MVFFNLLGFAWALIGIMVGTAANMLLGRPGNSVMYVVAGFMMIVVDLWWRLFATSEQGATRMFAPRAGGHIGFIPIWILGFIFAIQPLL